MVVVVGDFSELSIFGRKLAAQGEEQQTGAGNRAVNGRFRNRNGVGDDVVLDVEGEVAFVNPSAGRLATGGEAFILPQVQNEAGVDADAEQAHRIGVGRAGKAASRLGSHLRGRCGYL